MKNETKKMCEGIGIGVALGAGIMYGGYRLGYKHAMALVECVLREAAQKTPELTVLDLLKDVLKTTVL